jgi:hypothetical protein
MNESGNISNSYGTIDYQWWIFDKHKKEKSIVNEQFFNLTTNKSRGFNDRKSWEMKY